MPGAIGFGLLLVGVAILVWTHGEREIIGLAPEDFARLTALLALVMLIAGSAVSRADGGIRRAVGQLATWAMIFLAIVVVYAYRYEIDVVADRVLGELRPGRAAVTTEGDVSVRRAMDGSFVVEGEADGERLRFIFDTGASVVVVTADAARRLGYREGDLNYRVPVMTANGRTLAAPITIDSLRIGTIEARNVRALVARPDALPENLLGMSFLDRLESYEVRRDQLIMRAR